MKKLSYILAFLFTILLGTLAASAQVLVAGNPKCSDLGFNREVKLDPPVAGTTVIPSVGSITVTINTPSTLSFTTSAPAFVRAVIMKGGDNANVYLFNPAILGQDLLVTPVNNGGNIPSTSHVSFCYNLVSTASDSTLSGRLVFRGRGVASAVVSITNVVDNSVVIARTNGLGFFRANNLRSGQSYILSVKSKTATFEPIVFTLMQDLELGDIQPSK